MLELATLFLYIGFLFQVLGRFEGWRTKAAVEANFATWTASACCPPLRGQLAALVLMRSRDFSLALAVLHTFDVASLALQHQKVRGSFTQ